MAESAVKRKRGRPRKNPIKTETPEVIEGEVIGRYDSPTHKPRNKVEALKYVNGYKKPPKELRETGALMYKYMEDQGVGLAEHRITGDIPPATDEYGHWSKERDEHLFAFLSDGGLVTAWLRAAGLNRMALMRRKNRDPEFAARFEKARELGADALAEEALEIASTPKMTTDQVETTLADGGVMRAVKTYDNVYARKLAFQARLQLLAKWQPDRYGDKIAVNVNDSRAQQILEARKRLLGR